MFLPVYYILILTLTKNNKFTGDQRSESKSVTSGNYQSSVPNFLQLNTVKSRHFKLYNTKTYSVSAGTTTKSTGTTIKSICDIDGVENRRDNIQNSIYRPAQPITTKNRELNMRLAVSCVTLADKLSLVINKYKNK